MTTSIWFAHGMESGPWGRKITALAKVAKEYGLQVESPDYSFTMDPDARVRHLLGLFAARNPGRPDGKLLLAGSSMGGFVAAAASARLQPRGLFLMAPAVDIPGYDADTTPVAGRVDVLHGWDDDVIPAGIVTEWSRRHAANLHLLASGHTLNERLDDVIRLFRLFLDATLNPAEQPAP